MRKISISETQVAAVREFVLGGKTISAACKIAGVRHSTLYRLVDKETVDEIRHSRRVVLHKNNALVAKIIEYWVSSPDTPIKEISAALDVPSHAVYYSIRKYFGKKSGGIATEVITLQSKINTSL